MHRHDLDLDTEIVELELHQPRHGLQRFGGIARRAVRRRIVEQRQRRQFAGFGGVEQRHLPFLLDAPLGFDRAADGFDARRRLLRHASCAHSVRLPGALAPAPPFCAILAAIGRAHRSARRCTAQTPCPSVHHAAATTSRWKSETAASHRPRATAASRPAMLSAPTRVRSPTTWPSTPPAVSRQRAGAKCSVASAAARRPASNEAGHAHRRNSARVGPSWRPSDCAIQHPGRE